MNNLTTRALSFGVKNLLLICIAAMAGCSLPRSASTPVVYDFGPGVRHTLPASRMANLPPLELGVPQTSVALSGNAVHYRMAFVDAQQLKPYALARWSMPPAQLISARLREQLGQTRAIVAPGEIILPRTAALAAQPKPLLNLRLELEEFCQLFDAPDQSSGLLRLRATVTLRSAVGETLLAQRSFVGQQNAPTPDASGGVRALTAATDQVILEMQAWLSQLEQ